MMFHDGGNHYITFGPAFLQRASNTIHAPRSSTPHKEASVRIAIGAHEIQYHVMSPAVFAGGKFSGEVYRRVRVGVVRLKFVQNLLNNLETQYAGSTIEVDSARTLTGCESILHIQSDRF